MPRMRNILCAFALLALATTLGPFAPESAHGDDRDLFRASSDAPYIFILFDVTGSMYRRVDGSTPPLYEDSIDSKMFLAKQALFEVLDETAGINFGFATFPNQDELRIWRKDTPGGCDNAPYNDGGPLEPNAPQSDWTCDTIIPSSDNDTDVFCAGIETNDDSPNDDYWDSGVNQSFNVKFDTTTTATGLEIGDLVPLDWGNDNIEILQQRLAPNLIVNPAARPDFGVANYFEDTRTGGRRFIELVDDNAKPFMAVGLTPLAESLRDFRTWFEDWEEDARAADPEFECREVFVLLMTDGLETCEEDDAPVAVAESLRVGTGVETYVIGFAQNNPVLDDIAEAGGTEEAYFPEDKDELVAAFSEIFDSIQGQAKTFSSAVVPSLQSAAGRNVFLTSFNPVGGVPVWPGRLDAYIVPVPYVTTPDGAIVADRSNAAKCTNPDDIDEKSCWAWFASDELLEQAPDVIDPLTATLSDYQFGLGTDERRIFYGAERTNDDIPADRKCFLPVSIAATASDALCDSEGGDDDDLYGPTGMDLPDPDTWEDDAKEIFANLLAHRTAEIINVNAEEEEIDYVLGDIFHSQPTVTAPPGHSGYFASSLAGRLDICGPRVDGGPDPYLEPYSCFADTHAWRRRMVIAGSNDGQLHFFDSGRPVDDLHEDPFGEPLVTFTAGTGREIFSFVPRYLLPEVADLATASTQIYGMDGPVTLADVAIDPVHNGTPNEDEREWRSIVVGGLREGGRSYFALDITQPDRLDANNRPISFSGPVPSCMNDSGVCDYPFPMVLWEITDDWDEDGNQAADMAHTWSKPRVGRIRIDDGGDIIEKFVAFFGGGMDAEYKHDPINDNGTPDDPDDDYHNPWGGNYIYMVDVETGEIIYKRNVDVRDSSGNLIARAMVPSELAAVDTDFDTFIDTIYFGTTAGVMYKVDISEAQSIETFDVEDWSETDFSGPNPEPTIRSVDRIAEDEWNPFPVFDTGGRGIYYPPSVVFFTELNQYALSFGAGDREDLWSAAPTEGRFYFILDQNWTDTTSDLPFDELDYIRIGIDDNGAGSDNYITNPINDFEPGWILTLETDERVTEKSLVISGAVFFNSFVPEPFVPADGLCAQTGFSRVFAVLASNGDGLFVDPDDPDADGDRYQIVQDFATSPYIQSSSTDNKLPDDPTEPSDSSGLNEGQKAVRDKLKGLQPEECRFANYTINVSVDTTESGSQIVAPVPVCVIERNFRQF